MSANLKKKQKKTAKRNHADIHESNCHTHTQHMVQVEQVVFVRVQIEGTLHVLSEHVRVCDADLVACRCVRVCVL